MSGLTRRATVGATLSIAAGAIVGCTASGSTPTSRQLRIASGSMEPTLVPGQMVTVDLVADGKYQPRHQDIVFFLPPAEWTGFDPSQLIVSRVIGIPGDTVSCNGLTGSPVMLNGVVLREPYLYPGDTPSTIDFHVTVPSGCLWLLDDHRSVAIDCRYHLSDPDNGAFVPTGNVVGTYHEFVNQRI
jgi:signal peptidase I